MKILALALISGLLVCGAAWAGDQDFSLVNKTGVDLAELYISPAAQDSWGPDVLDVDVLLDGGTVNIEFAPDEDAEYWDIRVVDGEGTEVVFSRLNLTEISTVTLKITEGEAIAECK